jgi:hypothetical protein
MKIRKKAVVVDGAVWTGDPKQIWPKSHAAEAMTWHTKDGSFLGSGSTAPEQATLIIPTLEGDHNATPGDVIIRGIENEFYPCRKSVFVATYDVLERDPTEPDPFA